MKRFNILLIFTLTVAFFSCRDSDRDNDTSTNSSTDYAMGQSMVYDIFKLVHEAANSTQGITINNLTNTTSLFGCDTLIVDTVSNPMSITLQFNGNCVSNGTAKSGAITATFTSKYDVVGCVIDISFNNYTYGVYPIGGTISYTYIGLDGTSPKYNYRASNFSITNNNRSITWSGNQNITVSSGEATAISSDDNYTITGNASGLTYEGNSFSAIIDSDLSLLGNCNWVSTGIVTVSPANKNPRILDFGSGCNESATVQIYGIKHEIVIP